MNFIPSPNHDQRPKDVLIDTLVLHYTGMATAKEAIDRLCDPEFKVSSHYVVDEDGEITELVKPEHRAWHAGKSIWRGKENINENSIGIEIVNPGHEFGYRDFPKEQMDSVIKLCKELVLEHPIEARNVVGHSDVAPTRKEDPGELFDWELLATEGIGLWPHINEGDHEYSIKKGDHGDEVRDLQTRLVRYGYALITDGVFEIQTEFVVKAFQRHFGKVTNIDGVWNDTLDAKLNSLLEIISQ